MHIEKEEYQHLMHSWNKLLDALHDDLRRDLSGLELSELSSWLGDCLDSFVEIINHLESIDRASPANYELAHDAVVDIFWQLDHIKKHIVAAEKGFTALMNRLATKTEAEMKKNE